MGYPEIRPRRLRTTPALRRLVSETRLSPAELVLPMFVKEGLTEPRPIASMPGVVQHSRESLRKAAAEAVWGFLVQREILGMRDRNAVIAQYGIPREVLNRIGAR